MRSSATLSHELREPLADPGQNFMIRTLELVTSTFTIGRSRQGASAWVEQRWKWPMQSSGAIVAVRRRMTVFENSQVRLRSVGACRCWLLVPSTDAPCVRCARQSCCIWAQS